MKTKIIGAVGLLACALGAAGCAASLRETLSGKVGCPPAEVVVPDGAEFKNDFTAECRGHRFICSVARVADTPTYSCAPEQAPAQPRP